MAEQNLQSQMALKIKRQIEFYFSDSNYPQDKFMKTKAAENDGYIPLSTLLEFNRVKQITQDLDFLTAVLKTSDELVVKDDMVKRKKPLPETDTSYERSVTVNGLPTGEDKGVTMETVSEFFTAKFGKVLSVRLKRTNEKVFEGIAFVEFETEEDAKKALAGDSVWPDDVKLSVVPRKRYIKVEKVKPEKPQKNRKEHMKVEKEKDERSIIKGTILEVTNVPSDTSQADVKAYFSKFGKVRYAEFYKPETKMANIRFCEPEATAAALAEVSEKKMIIGESVLEARLLEGEEEEKFWNEKIIPYLTQPKPARGKRRKPFNPRRQ